MVKITKQAKWSDWGKKASTKVATAWGGRRTDGRLDSKKPKSFFKYTTKHKSATTKGKSILKYPTSHRQIWKSYGIKYGKKKTK